MRAPLDSWPEIVAALEETVSELQAMVSFLTAELTKSVGMARVVPDPYNDPLRVATRQARVFKAALKELSTAVSQAVGALDATVKLPESGARGKAFAAIANHLEYANDQARYFHLGVDYRTDKKRGRNKKSPEPASASAGLSTPSSTTAAAVRSRIRRGGPPNKRSTTEESEL